jgi:hypothetical protein
MEVFHVHRLRTLPPLASEKMICYVSRSFPLQVSEPLMAAGPLSLLCLPGLLELLRAPKEGLDEFKAREVGVGGWPADDMVT